MHKIQMYENLRDMLEREVKEIEKQGNLSPQALDNVYKLTCSIKNIDKCIEKEEEEMGGMSKSYRNSRGSYGSYDGMSNARRSRDDGSRYSEDSFRYSQDRGMNSYRYSRDTAKESMVNRLMQMADNTMNDEDRMAIMDCINKIQ